MARSRRVGPGFLDRHPQVCALILLPIGLGVAGDVRRLARAVSAFGHPMATAVIAGTGFGVVCVTAAALGIGRALRSAHREPTRVFWRRRTKWWSWVVIGWIVLSVTAGVWTHPKHADSQRWPLTTPLGGAVVAYLVVFMLGVAILIAVFTLVMPVSVWWENRRRRRARGSAPPGTTG